MASLACVLCSILACCRGGRCRALRTGTPDCAARCGACSACAVRCLWLLCIADVGGCAATPCSVPVLCCAPRRPSGLLLDPSRFLATHATGAQSSHACGAGRADGSRGIVTWQAVGVQDKVKVKAALRAAGVTVESDTEWSDFLAALEAPEIQERLKCAPPHPTPPFVPFFVCMP